MAGYCMEECSDYDVTYINQKPIVVFEKHNMALPIWGVIADRLGKPLNLITFDSHTDTLPSFNRLLREYGSEGSYNKSESLNKPLVKRILQGKRYLIKDFSFEDVYIIAKSLHHTEQIMTAISFDYLLSYTVVHKAGEIDYEENDRSNGYDASYIGINDLIDNNTLHISAPFILDIDLDFFACKKELDLYFCSYIKPLVKIAAGITIARETVCFNECRCEKCDNDPAFSIESAKLILLEKIKAELLS